jgi:hypothetical protein
MTPQDIDNLQNAINALQQSVNGLANSTGIVGSSLNNLNGQVLNSSQSARTAGQNFQAAGQNIVSSSMSVASAQQQAAQQIAQNNASIAQSAQTLKNQVGQAASAMATSTGSLNNFSGAAGAVGGALGTLAARLGLPAAAAAGLATAFGSLANVFLGQTQALLGARDSLNKLGGVGQQTASSLYSYAHAAGLHSDTISRMINPIASLGPALLGLGRGAGDAQKAFFELVQVGNENRKQFANIGVFQEEMMKYQGNYVAAQDAAGISLRMQNANMSKLQAASLEYIKNLYELSALTGEEVSTIEKRMRAAREDPIIQLRNLMQQEEINALRQQAEQKDKEGTPESAREAEQLRREAQRLEDELKFRNAVVDQLSVLPAGLQKGVKELLTTGVLGKDNLQMFMSGAAQVIPELAEQARNARDKETGALLAPEDQAKVFADLLAKEMYEPGGRLGQLATTVGPAALLNEQLRNQLFPSDAMKQYARQPEDRAQLRSEAAQQIASAMTSGADSASKIASSLQEAAVALGQATDKLQNVVNPFVQDFDINTQSPVATEEAKRQAAPTTEIDNANKIIGTLDNIAKSDQAAVNFLGSIADDVEKILGLFGINVSEEAKRFKELAQNNIVSQQNVSDPQKSRESSTPAAPVGSEILRRGENTARPVTPQQQQPATQQTTAPQQQQPATQQTTAPQQQQPATQQTTAPQQQQPATQQTTAPQQQQPATQQTTAPQQQQTTQQAAPPTTNVEQDRTTQTEINFQPINVQTNLGTTLELNASLVGKIAGFIRQSNNRARSLRPKVMLALDSAGTKNVGKLDTKTLDTIIDKVANQARLSVPPGSTAGTTTPEAPVVTPESETQPQGPNIAELVNSGRLQAETPAMVASKIATPTLRQGAVPTSLAKLIDTGVIDPKYLRGPQEIPTNIRTNARGRKFADDADSKTRDTHGEGYGLDPKLLDGIVKLQQADFGDLTLQHITALNDYYHALNFNNTAHKDGRAVDFTLNKAPTPEQSAKIINILKGIGFGTVKDEYNYPTSSTEGKHFHAEIPKQELPSLDMGGIVRGPKSGFPAMLHGNEMVIPLSPDSLLAELGKKGSDQFASETKTAQQESENISATTLKDDLIRANEMIAKVLTSKLDEVILKLDTGNQTSHKILRHSQV